MLTMMNRFFDFLRTSILAVCLAHTCYAQGSSDLLSRHFDYHMISSGNNFPSVNLEKDHLGDICLLLHAGASLDQVRDIFHWNESELQSRLEVLQGAALLEKIGNGYYPRITVITGKDAGQYFAVSPSLVDETAMNVRKLLPRFKREYANVPALRPVPFRQISFFLLSDVLLDNWQIDTVENEMFQQPRSQHGDKHYYYSMQEKTSATTESFGIYGNSQAAFGEVAIGLYGNTRESENLVTLSSAKIAEKCGLEPTVNGQPLKKTLLAEMVKAFPAATAIVPAHLQCLQRLGLLARGSYDFPVLADSDNQALSALAKIFTQKLLMILNGERSSLERIYRLSPYAQEISFQEFFMWWYHFFYTEVTNRLIEEKLIEPPPAGTFTYLWRDQK